ncbi:MAG: sigma-70 family RNA polymerase sigma factor [Ginsengibacter sp.]|jgi:RNA polymerase sigma-70 factor (ECF subfamily)
MKSSFSVNTKYSEEELISLLKSKDRNAFAYLYDNYSQALFGVIHKMVNNQELAEDILQEAFIKIWNRFDDYDSTKGRLFTWMLNISRNFTIDTFRSKDYKKQSKILNKENSVDNINIKNASDSVDNFDALGIRKHLSLLKSDQKIIIDLAYFEGFTQDEISKELSIPLGTVKTRMRSAILELRKILN